MKNDVSPGCKATSQVMERLGRQKSCPAPLLACNYQFKKLQGDRFVTYFSGNPTSKRWFGFALENPRPSLCRLGTRVFARRLHLGGVPCPPEPCGPRTQRIPAAGTISCREMKLPVETRTLTLETRTVYNKGFHFWVCP